MLRCLSSTRFAVRGPALRFHSRNASIHHDNLNLHRRGVTTRPAEREQGETLYVPIFNPSLTSDSEYLDFILSGKEGDPLVRGSDEARNGLRELGKAASRQTTRRERLQSPGQSKRPNIDPAQLARDAARWKAWVRGRHERPHSVSLRSLLRTSAVYSSSWQTKYATIARKYDSGLEDVYLREIYPPEFQPDTEAWVNHLSARMSHRKDPFSVEAYARSHGKIGREVWSEVALWLMCKDIDRLPDFLLATHTPLYPPINWVEDCLLHLARYYNHLGALLKEAKFRRLIEVFRVIVHRDTKEQFAFDGGFIRHLLHYCTIEQVNELYECIKSHTVRVRPNTLHHFSDWFATNGRIEQALDALLEAKSYGGIVQGLPFRKNCATLLRKSLQHPGGLRVCLRIIENLVSIGVKLDMRLCNIIMLNAVESGDRETMYSIHRSAAAQGLADDEYTCAILLKACKLDIDDADNLRIVIQKVIQHGDVRHNILLATEILHCLALHHTKHNPESAYKTVSEAYVQLFDPAPLERLGLPIPNTARAPLHPEPPMAPSQQVLNFVVASYLEHSAGNDEVQRVYATWRTQVAAGDPELAPLASKPHFANMFLQKFCRVKSSLLNAAQVVKDMQKSLPPSAGVKQCEPDVYTWSIFVDGFARKGQMKLAEQVLNYMRSKGIEPNPVTWNSLITGYAGQQDMDGTLDALRRQNDSGSAYDEWTAGGLRKFKNQQRLREELEKQRFQQSMDFTREIKNNLEVKLGTTDGSAGDASVASDGASISRDTQDIVQGL